jgi:uncharacterized protein (TIGR02588 family)
MTMPHKNALEWAVFAVSAVVIAAIVATLAHHEITRPDSPPDLQVRVLAAREAAGGVAVTLKVENRGGTTAASVAIEALFSAAGTTERGQVVIPYVPAGSSRTGEVLFSRKPGPDEFKVRVAGYELP